MRLLFAPASPFSAKVRMAAHLCGVRFEESAVETAPEPDELLAVNPLGKIPALVLDDGRTLHDSSVICEYLNRSTGNPILPQATEEWLAAKRLEATADGVADAAILVLYERRYRPEEKHHQPWVDRQWRRATRGLAAIEREVGEVPARPTVGHLAVAALLGWLDLRFAGRWDADRPMLNEWKRNFFSAFPDLAALQPKA